MKFFIILTILFFLFRLIMPHVMRWALKAFVKKTINNGTFTNAAGPFTQNRPPQPEGEIKVEYIPKDPKPKDFRGGEYVDYEEVK
ncbi:hypothetical protein [Adhaeribacter aquaticus]|uniref:hypothetical protein n=1 Tax=Adhaeribacter aquaticus TaxID=299567 RepID=UPI00047CCA32|nr:hypothetical protein [Adhaeribacter aquaticus]